MALYVLHITCIVNEYSTAPTALHDRHLTVAFLANAVTTASLAKPYPRDKTAAGNKRQTRKNNINEATKCFSSVANLLAIKDAYLSHVLMGNTCISCVTEQH